MFTSLETNSNATQFGEWSIRIENSDEIQLKWRCVDQNMVRKRIIDRGNAGQVNFTKMLEGSSQLSSGFTSKMPFTKILH